MSLSDRELQFLISILSGYVEMMDARACSWQGDVNSQRLAEILDERKKAYQLKGKLRELSIAPKQYTILVQIPDRFVDRN